MPDETTKEPIPVVYNFDEQQYVGSLKTRMNQARDDRDQAHDEFDGMDYVNWYDTNRRADQSHIPPKKNSQDTRIVSGITHERGNSLLSATLNFNFEPNIQAYNKDNELVYRIGEDMEDMTRKSREIELYDQKRPQIYRELISQGTCFVENLWTEKFEVSKEIEDFNPLSNNIVKARDVKWVEDLQKVFEGSVARLIDGRSVYLGNIREFWMQDQPFVFTREIKPRSEIAETFKNWERWKNVPMTLTPFFISPENDHVLTQDWLLRKTTKDMVEIIKYYDPNLNEFQLILNGVMMLPIKFPLTVISPSGAIPVAKGDLEPVAFFAYSKGLASKTKVDQAVYDRFLQLMILQQEKKNAPPYMNATKQVLSSRIHLPGVIISNIKKGQLNEIGENKGISQSDVAMFGIIRQIIDENSVNSTFAGQADLKVQTATEIFELKKQQVMKLGLSIAGIKSFEKQLSWLRIYDVVKNWTKVKDEKLDETQGGLVSVYQRFFIDATFKDGKRGIKIVDFNPTKLTSEEIFKEEKKLTEEQGRTVRLVFIEPDMLRKMKIFWFVDIVPTEKDNDALKQKLFSEKMVQAANLFGIDRLNMPRLEDRWSQIDGEKKEDWFKEEPVQPLQPATGQIPVAGQSAQVPTVAPTPTPTVNTLNNA